MFRFDALLEMRKLGLSVERIHHLRLLLHRPLPRSA
eukprot:COSAG06_NODE_39508_length_411_cov_7.964744_1_plen_35_part_01